MRLLHARKSQHFLGKVPARQMVVVLQLLGAILVLELIFRFLDGD